MNFILVDTNSNSRRVSGWDITSGHGGIWHTNKIIGTNKGFRGKINEGTAVNIIKDPHRMKIYKREYTKL